MKNSFLLTAEAQRYILNLCCIFLVAATGVNTFAQTNPAPQYAQHLILNETTDTITVAADSNCITLCDSCTTVLSGTITTSPAPNQHYCINSNINIQRS